MQWLGNTSSIMGKNAWLCAFNHSHRVEYIQRLNHLIFVTPIARISLEISELVLSSQCSLAGDITCCDKSFIQLSMVKLNDLAFVNIH
jgi:hypothetical protein